MRKQAPRGQATNLLTVTQLVRSGARIGACRQEATAWPSVLLTTLFTLLKGQQKAQPTQLLGPRSLLALDLPATTPA